MKLVSEARYREACANDEGWCTSCEDFTRDSDTEPDAEEYPCPECEQRTCMGAEQALLTGAFDIGGDDADVA